MMKKIWVVILILLMLSLPVYAFEGVDEYITDEMEQNLPEDILDDENVINYDSLLDHLVGILAEQLPGVMKNLMSILSVVIISAVFSVFCDSIKSPGIKDCFSYLSSACVAIILYGVLASVWEDMSVLLTDINSFMNTLTPVTTVLYSLGGNITTSAVNNAAMGIILTVFENICFYGIRPMLQICFGFSIVSALSGSVNLKGVAGFIRKTYTTVLVFVMSSMMCILSLQNMLTQANDSLALRTVKFAASSSIPLVGGSLGEATSTVATGIVSIKSTFGVLAIIALAIMVLPGILSIWLNKLSFSIGATVCSVFGLDHNGELIGGAGELLNFALAVTMSSAVMFIINISIFAGAACAIAP